MTHIFFIPFTCGVILAVWQGFVKQNSIQSSNRSRHIALGHHCPVPYTVTQVFFMTALNQKELGKPKVVSVQKTSHIFLFSHSLESWKHKSSRMCLQTYNWYDVLNTIHKIWNVVVVWLLSDALLLFAHVFLYKGSPPSNIMRLMCSIPGLSPLSLLWVSASLFRTGCAKKTLQCTNIPSRNSVSSHNNAILGKV